VQAKVQTMQRSRSVGRLRAEHFAEVCALAEVMRTSNWPSARAARFIVEDVAGVLVARGRLPGVEIAGRWYPRCFFDGTDRYDAPVARDWQKLMRIYAVKDDRIEESLGAAPQARDTLLRSAEIGIEVQNCGRAIVRSALRALGLTAKEASDLLPGIKFGQRERQLHYLTDFVVERLEFGTTRAALLAVLHGAYVDWLKGGGGKGPAMPMKVFASELRRSMWVKPYKAGSNGSRARGLKGVGLRLVTAAPGILAPGENASFLRALASPDFAEQLAQARQVEAERPKRQRT